MPFLGELIEIKGGGTPSKKVSEYWGGSIPWASVKDFKSSVLSSTADSITDLGVENSATSVIPAGTIVVPTRMALGKVAITAVDMAINQDLKALLINNEQVLDKNYLLRFLESQAGEIEKHGKGATVKGITLDVLRGLEIPLPPLAEQKRIAAILDKADALRRKRQQAIDLADQFLRSVFLEMFGDPVTNPKGWAEKPLAQGVNTIESGWSASGDNSPATKDQLGVLKISAVTSGFFRPEENKAVEVSSVPVGKKLLKPRAGDLLFSRANTRELVAATAIVDQDYDNLFLPDKLWRVGTNEKMLPEFLHFLLKQPRMRDRLTSQATGTSGSMLNISKKKFEETPVIFPPSKEQFRFGEVFKKTRNVCTSKGRSVEELNLLFNSLSQQAFRGEL